MNRIAIILNQYGELDRVVSDLECRVFVVDNNCVSEPVYELSEALGKFTGVQHVRLALGDNMAATYESTGPWLETKPSLSEVKQ